VHLARGSNSGIDIVDDEASYARIHPFRIEPQLNALTCVPHAIASIMTSPNGSGQSPRGGNRVTLAKWLRVPGLRQADV
jgi:hypothetical protein